jgi:hypothetical protein
VGWKNLTFAREKDGDRRPKAETGDEAEPSTSRPARRRKRTETPEIGHALRSVYDKAVAEQVPKDLLDLLGKLG